MATNKLLLGVDVGTSGCKTVLLDGRGRVVASASRTYAIRRGLDGEVTQDSDDWLAAVRRTVRECLSGSDGRDVAALSITGPAHYAVLCNAEGQPLGRVLLSSDGRPEQVTDELRARLGERFFELTGERLTAAWTFPQLVWLRRTYPALWPKLRMVLVVKDYVRFRLTGEAATDTSDAAGTALYDQARRTWSAELCDVAGLDAEMLPPIKEATATGGRLSADWAGRLGLPAGLPVAVGATDTLAELVSVGAMDGGDAIVKIASTGTVVAVTDRLRPHPMLLAYPHAVPGRWYTVAATNTAATAFTWLRETLFSEDSPSVGDAYRRMDAMAGRVPPGSNGLLFLPFLEGERTPYWDRDLRGAFLGMSSSHTRRHVCRAVLEGVALSLRACRDTMAEAGISIERPVYAGGGTASSVWRTILASVLGLEGRLAEPQGPAVGAAYFAAAAIRVPPAPDGNLVARPRSRPVKPRIELTAVYDELYVAYREAVTASASVSHRLARLGRSTSSKAG
jgi:xylulokinase